MTRTLTIITAAAACLLLLLAPETAFGQDWSYSGDPLERGPGQYLAWYKLLPMWIVFLMWVYTTDWVNQDSQEIGDGIGMPYNVWNPIIVFTFVPVFVIVAPLMPMYAISIGLVLLAYFVPLAIYVFQRNGKVQQDQKVLTAAHLKLWFSNLGRARKVKPQKKLAYEEGPPIDFIAVAAGDDSVDKANLIAARQSPAFVDLKELVNDMMRKRAQRCMLDYTESGVAVRFEVDGVWHNLDNRERETYDVVLAILKKLCNLNINDRRSRQQGEVKFKAGKPKYTIDFTSQGTQTGERALLVVSSDDSPLKTLESQGMREKMLEQMHQLVRKNGIVVVSALPQGGLTTELIGTLNAADRLLKDFTSIQDKADPLPYVENLEVTFYDKAAGETPDKYIRALSLKQPDAFVVPEPPNAETISMLCDEALSEERVVIISVRAKEAVEALMRVLLLKAPAEKFAKAVNGVLNVRLVRRLCEKCKQPYEPPPQLLQRLGIPPGRVQALYREWQPPTGDDVKKADLEPCTACNGLGYKGRIGIFELLVVNDTVRKALVNQPNLDTLRKAARAAGTRTIQEEGIVLVAQGVTSLNELQRVLKA